MNTAKTLKVLVVGSTGATGKHVVQMLLDRGDTEVVALARSQEKLMGLLGTGQEKFIKNLVVKEASITEMTDAQIKDLTEGCTAVVSCLGHNLTFKGMFREGLFVSESVQKLTRAMPSGSRFVMMGTDAVAYPDGSDPKRTRFERGILRFMRWILPPVKDNELAAAHLFEIKNSWVAVRPGDLVETEDAELLEKSKKDYEIYKHTFGGLFGDNSTYRSQVADFLVDLATMSAKAFKTYNRKMPVIYSRKDDAGKAFDNDETLISTHE